MAGPPAELIDQYNGIVDNVQYDINDQHHMANTKQMDSKKLHEENIKFLLKSKGKTSWDMYEHLLANERVTNERLVNVLREKKHTIKSLFTEGSKGTYDDFLAKTLF